MSLPPIPNVSVPQTDNEGSAQGHSECSSKLSYPNSLPPKIKTRDELRTEFGFNGTFGDFGEDLIRVADEPDSDIPEELHHILRKGSQLSVDDTLSFNGESPLGIAIGSPSELAHSDENVSSAKKAPSLSPCPGLPPAIPLPSISKDLAPVFRATLTDDQDRQAAVEPDSPHSPLENDTKKTFDFTGEINRLNASGEGNRLSFLEQLEQAFPDPAKLQSFDFDRSLLMPSISFKLTAPADTSADASRSFSQESICHSDSVPQVQRLEPTPFEDIAVPSIISPAAPVDSTRGSSISPLVMQNVSTMSLHPRSSIISLSASPLPESATCGRFYSGPAQESLSNENQLSADSIFDEHNKPSADSIFNENRTTSRDLSSTTHITDPLPAPTPSSAMKITAFDPSTRVPSSDPFLYPAPRAASRGKKMTQCLSCSTEIVDHVRRQSIGSSFEASPCIRMERHFREVRNAPPSAMKRKLETIPSVQFGEGRMGMARKGLLERQSLEDGFGGQWQGYQSFM